MQSPYSISKLVHHPHLVEAFARGERPAPTLVHLMWQNLCSQDCHFCSYRMSNWKNSEQFDDSQSIPWDITQRTLRELRAMGTKAIELTGGGEPTIYPKFDQGINLIDELGFDVGLVTNGATFGAVRALRFEQMKGWKWARVSIDAGKVDTYCAVRRVTPTHWDRAWKTVRQLAEARDHRAAAGDTEIRVGAGFVVTRENHAELLEFCGMAKTAGADNVRLSLRFGPDGNDYYLPGQLDEAERQAIAAKSALDDDRFCVVNLVGERRHNQAAQRQDYEPCYSMRVICVIGGDAKVYTCCTLAFTPDGEIGSLRDKSFGELWSGIGGDAFFKAFKTSEKCNVACLYEMRNKAMIKMVDAVRAGESLPAMATPPHVNFI